MQLEVGYTVMVVAIYCYGVGYGFWLTLLVIDCDMSLIFLTSTLFHLCRYNIPELAKTYKVYAVDLLGFGWSEKATIEYDAMVWRDQVVDFLKEIVKEPAVLVGNR